MAVYRLTLCSLTHRPAQKPQQLVRKWAFSYFHIFRQHAHTHNTEFSTQRNKGCTQTHPLFLTHRPVRILTQRFPVITMFLCWVSLSLSFSLSLRTLLPLMTAAWCHLFPYWYVWLLVLCRVRCYGHVIQDPPQHTVHSSIRYTPY